MIHLKVAYFGNPAVAVPPLEALAKAEGIQIVFVGVFPDKAVGRKQILTPCSVKVKAQELGIPLKEIETKADLIKAFEADFDIAIVVAFGMIFPQILFQGKSKPIINVHFSLLPCFRGASPVQAALLSGAENSGITFQAMRFELDEGDILWQETYPIVGKNTLELWGEWAQITGEKLPSFLLEYQKGLIKGIPQTERGEVSYCQKIERADGEIFPRNENAQTIERRYRAFAAWPGIFLKTTQGDLKIKGLQKTAPLEGNGGHLSCAENSSLWITSAQIPGKTVMTLEAIENGYGKLFS